MSDDSMKSAPAGRTVCRKFFNHRFEPCRGDLLFREVEVFVFTWSAFKIRYFRIGTSYKLVLRNLSMIINGLKEFVFSESVTCLSGWRKDGFRGERVFFFYH